MKRFIAQKLWPALCEKKKGQNIQTQTSGVVWGAGDGGREDSTKHLK